MVFEYQDDKLVEYSAVQSYKASWVVLDGLASDVRARLGLKAPA